MKFSTTGFAVIYLGTNKLIIYSVGAHHLEMVVEETLGIDIGSTEAVCNLYDESKKQKDVILRGEFKIQSILGTYRYIHSSSWLLFLATHVQETKLKEGQRERIQHRMETVTRDERSIVP